MVIIDNTLTQGGGGGQLFQKLKVAFEWEYPH